MYTPDIPSAIKRHESAPEALGLLLILILACFIRCDRLSYPPLSNDEAFSWRLATYSIPELLCHMPGDAHPPLYYLILKNWIALFGDAPFALRSLSVLFTMASIVVLCALCRESTNRFPSASNSPSTRMSGALFAALLLAIHLAPVDEPSRIARMYSQGIFLAGLTAWLLLRALSCSRGCFSWWLGYGLGVAAFCYTHYYAFFVVGAQTLFLFGDLAVRARKSSGASVRTSLTGCLLAGCLAFLLYIPWLPVWCKQTHDVWQGFWIPPVTWEHIKEVFFRWSSGLPNFYPIVFPWWCLFLLTCIFWIVAKNDRHGLFLLMQACISWILSLAVSSLSDRPIFHERYLLFAQFFLFAFWGVVWDRLPSWLPQVGLGCFLLGLGFYSVEMVRERWPAHSPTMATVAAFLRDHRQDGDVILVDSPSTLNRFRYYSIQAGIPMIRTHCILSPSQPPGHVLHLGSLQAEDILWMGSSSEQSLGERVWTLVERSAGIRWPGEHWREDSQWSFDNGNYQLILYERSSESCLALP